MRRTTIKLPDDLDARLRHEAARRGMTISELSREAIAAHLGAGGGKRVVRHLGATGAMRSGTGDLSKRVEEILAEEWGRGR
jgi:hypothetical protein